MSDMLTLALDYGGFTSLDKVYLEGLLSTLTPEQQLAYITPPPSVINAYFAEIYQKQNPQAATAYFLDLSKSLKLIQTEPSFAEKKPFIRLNLSGKSFGFAYVNKAGLAQIFPEKGEEWDSSLLFELAQIFPHLLTYQKDEKIFAEQVSLEHQDWQEKEQERFLLTQLAESADWIRIAGLNQDEVLEAAEAYPGQVYYAWSGRQAILYIRK
ncbi:cystathionine beta-lyase [Streptococcus sp.]|uniref:cystathionine beta-lyase n=1 Tax=Streptococcus sp. TaxID=1306 RepID=UPI0035A0BDB2